MSDTTTDYRTCIKCGILKHFSDYYKSRPVGGTSKYICKMCHRAQIKGYEKDPDKYAHHYRKWRNLKASAQKRGLSFDLTVEDYWDVRTGGVCHYCGSEEEALTIDRKDNSLGYDKENIVGACWDCNSLKSDKLDYQEMLDIRDMLIRHKARLKSIHTEVN